MYGIMDDITDLKDLSLSMLRELVVDREAWRAAVYGVTKNQTWLSDCTELSWHVYLIQIYEIKHFK